MFARSYGGMSPGIRQQGGQLPDIESQMREQRGFGGMANPPRMPPQTMPPQGMINDLQSTVGGIPGASLSQSPPNQGVFGDIQNAISSRSNNAPPDLASVAAQQSGGLQTPGINGFNPRGGFGTPMGGGGQMLGGAPEQNKYDRFAAAMMQARGRRGMGGRPMAKPMLGGMGGPMTRPQAPRGGMQQSPPIVPQPMTNTMQKPGRLTQPGAPVFTAPAGVGEY